MTYSATLPVNRLPRGIRSSSSCAARIGAMSRSIRTWVSAPSSPGMPSTESPPLCGPALGAAGLCSGPDTGQLPGVDVGPPRRVLILDGPHHALARRRGACSDDSPVDGGGSTACCATLKTEIRGVLCTTLGRCWVSFLLAMPFCNLRISGFSTKLTATKHVQNLLRVNRKGTYLPGAYAAAPVPGDDQEVVDERGRVSTTLVVSSKGPLLLPPSVFFFRRVGLASTSGRLRFKMPCSPSPPATGSRGPLATTGGCGNPRVGSGTRIFGADRSYASCSSA